MRDPEALLERRVEAAILDHANPRVLDGHVRSAAFEAPLDEKDAETLGPEALERAAQLPDLRRKDGGFVWAGRDYPAGRFGLRSATPDSFTVVDVSTGSLLGLVEQERAYSTVHQGAVYLHLGESYRVAELDLENRDRPRRAVHRRRVHPGEEGHDDGDRRAAPRRPPARRRPLLRPRRRHRAGRRLPAEAHRRRRDDRDPSARPSRRRSSRPRRSGSSPKTRCSRG